jgi:hypothetical protein
MSKSEDKQMVHEGKDMPSKVSGPDDKQMAPETPSKLYLHIGDGGVSFEVVDQGHGPTVVISSSHFGNDNLKFSFHTDQASLVQLSTMFLKAAFGKKYSKDYCYKAHVLKLSGSMQEEDIQDEKDSIK